jgi:hypothetical protein
MLIQSKFSIADNPDIIYDVSRRNIDGLLKRDSRQAGNDRWDYEGEQSMKPSQFHFCAEQKKNTLIWLWILFALGVVLRFGLARITSANPFVMPDELLYSNIARSLISGDGVSFRNQPIMFTNLLYPFLISPVYAFAPPGLEFRAIQLFNALVMNLAVFPAYFIARRFVQDRKILWGITVASILLPDMILANRIMAEAVMYPLFLYVVYRIFKRLDGEDNTVRGAILLSAISFALMEMKAIAAAVPVAFAGLLMIDFLLFYRKKDSRIAGRPAFRRELTYILAFIGAFLLLMLSARIVNQYVWGVNYGKTAYYLTSASLFTLDHIKRTIPGILLYLFFVPVAMGVFPLLVPAAASGLYSVNQRKQLRFVLVSLAGYIFAAVYLIFDQETIGNYYQGRIHIRYVFMYLPILLAFFFAPALEKYKLNFRLVGSVAFLLAMTFTVSFGALLSNRIYCVDALSLSYIIYDDPSLNMKLFSQIAFLVFVAAVLWLMYKGLWKKALCTVAVCLLAGIAVNNYFGYDLNLHNNETTLSADAGEAARILNHKTTLLVESDGLYFGNNLSTLDTAMNDAPYMVSLEDLCASLGDYGKLESVLPPQYWTENPVNAADSVDYAVFENAAFYRMLPASGAIVFATANGYYGIIKPSDSGLLLHSALTGMNSTGIPGANAALYIFDPTLLAQKTITVYLEVTASASDTITLSAASQTLPCEVPAGTNWIYATFAVDQGLTKLPVSIAAGSGTTAVITYQLK